MQLDNKWSLKGSSSEDSNFATRMKAHFTEATGQRRVTAHICNGQAFEKRGLD